LRQRLGEQRIGLDISVAAVDRLGEAGFDPVYGARPLKRAIQNTLETPLAQALLEGRFGPGDEIKVDVDADRFTFAR
jgi:ATP-dependent Clp protease ATP-binding subunit ClpB